MNYLEAQRLIDHHNILAAELPPAIEFGERLGHIADTIVRQCRQLSPGSAAVTVREYSDDGLRISRHVNPAVALLANLRQAAADLSRLCLVYDHSRSVQVLQRVQGLERLLTDFLDAAPAMRTDYYTGPIRVAVDQIRSMVTTTGKAVK